MQLSPRETSITLLNYFYWNQLIDKNTFTSTLQLLILPLSLLLGQWRLSPPFSTLAITLQPSKRCPRLHKAKLTTLKTWPQGYPATLLAFQDFRQTWVAAPCDKPCGRTDPALAVPLSWCHTQTPLQFLKGHNQHTQRRKWDPDTESKARVWCQVGLGKTDEAPDAEAVPTHALPVRPWSHTELQWALKTRDSSAWR